MRDAKDAAALPRDGAGDGRLPRGAPTRLIPLAALFYGALLGVAVAWRLWVDGVLPWRAHPSPPAVPLPLRLALGVAYGIALIVASRLWTARTAAGRRLSDQLAAAIGPISTRAAILLAAISGLAEEAFFRGAVQPRVGWLLASAAFGLAHFHPRRDLRAWSASAFVAGLGFAALFEFTGDLTASATAHFLLNAVNLRWLAKRDPAAALFAQVNAAAPSARRRAPP